MWSCDTELCTNGVEATKCWVFVAHFSIYSTSRCRCHTGTDIPRLRGHTLQINQVVRTVRQRISCCAPTIHWKCDAQIQNRQIKSPPALWKHLSFQCLGVIVTLNGKSATMLLEPTKNKLKQWRVIEKSVNKCNFFSQMFWIITKWMKITEKQICEDQIVTFKQSHILYQGLLFLTRSTCVIVDARSHTCKSHDFLPRYDIILKTASNGVVFVLGQYRFCTGSVSLLCWVGMAFVLGQCCFCIPQQCHLPIAFVPVYKISFHVCILDIYHCRRVQKRLWYQMFTVSK